MSEQVDYMAPQVLPEKKISPIWKALKGSFEILIHGLIPHQRAKEPAKKFEKSHIGTDDGYLYETAIEIYKESSTRIDSLEEKGFKLLTYISAVSAILIYFLSKDIEGMYKFCVILSLSFLVIAIIISLRCIGVKSQKALFIDSLFTFQTTSDPTTKDKKTVTAEILNCAVFNQTVADNTADILRASRIMLSLGIITTIISCVFFLATPGNKDDKKIYQTKVSFADSTFTKSLTSSIKTQESIVKEMNDEILKLKRKLDSISAASKIQTVKKIKHN